MRELIRRSGRWCAFLLLACTTGCSLFGYPAGRACIRVRSDVSLNLYEGKPHATNLRFYPLADALGFVQTSVDELLRGARPPGMTLSEPIEVTIFPGQPDYLLDRQFPEQTNEIGVLADYYRRPGDAEGSRTLVVEAACGRRAPRVYMSVRDLRMESDKR